MGTGKYVANTDGTGMPVNVSSSNDGYDGLPSLSADGSKVAWTRDSGWFSDSKSHREHGRHGARERLERQRLR